MPWQRGQNKVPLEALKGHNRAKPAWHQTSPGTICLAQSAPKKRATVGPVACHGPTVIVSRFLYRNPICGGCANRRNITTMLGWAGKSPAFFLHLAAAVGPNTSLSTWRDLNHTLGFGISRSRNEFEEGPMQLTLVRVLNG